MILRKVFITQSILFLKNYRKIEFYSLRSHSENLVEKYYFAKYETV